MKNLLLSKLLIYLSAEGPSGRQMVEERGGTYDMDLTSAELKICSWRWPALTEARVGEGEAKYIFLRWVVRKRLSSWAKGVSSAAQIYFYFLPKTPKLE